MPTEGRRAAGKRPAPSKRPRRGGSRGKSRLVEAAAATADAAADDDDDAAAAAAGDAVVAFAGAAAADAVASPWDRLPDEIALRILCMVGDRWIVTRAHTVCVRWRRLCSDVPISLNFHDFSNPGELRPGREHTLLPVTPRADELIGGDPNEFGRFLAGICARFRGVRHLPDELCVTDEALIAIVSECPNLRTFSPVKNQGDGSRNPSRVLLALAASCPKLAHLMLCGPAASERGLIRVAEGCRELTHVVLQDCRAVTDATLLALAASRPKLQQFWLLSDETTRSVTDRGVKAIARACPSLRDIAFAAVTVTDASLHAFAESCPLLDSFRFATRDRECPVSDAGASAVAARCPGLETVAFCGAWRLTDDAVVAFASRCPCLEDVEFPFALDVTDASASALAANCPRLRKLDLSGTQVTDEAVRCLIDVAEELHELTLESAHGLTDRAVMWVTDGGQHHVHKCKISGDGVSDLAMIRLSFWHVEQAAIGGGGFPLGMFGAGGLAGMHAVAGGLIMQFIIG